MHEAQFSIIVLSGQKNNMVTQDTTLDLGLQNKYEIIFFLYFSDASGHRGRKNLFWFVTSNNNVEILLLIVTFNVFFQ